MPDSLRPHQLQHARLPCPSPTPGVYSNSRPLSQWCHPTTSSSITPFFSCPQSPSISLLSRDHFWPVGFPLNISIKHNLNRRLTLWEYPQMEKTWAVTNIRFRYKENTIINTEHFLWFFNFWHLRSYFFLFFFFWKRMHCLKIVIFKLTPQKRTYLQDKWFLIQCRKITHNRSLAGPPTLGKSNFNILLSIWLT